MPRKSHKKKKGKIVRPGMEQVETATKSVVNSMNDQLAGLGLQGLGADIMKS